MKKLTTYLLLGLSTALFAQVDYERHLILNDSLALRGGTYVIEYEDLNGDQLPDIIAASLDVRKFCLLYTSDAADD